VIVLGVLLIGWILWQAPFVRELVVGWSGRLGPRAVPLLRKVLNDSDNMVRMAAVSSLAEVGPDAVPPLLDTLREGSAAVRAESANALAYLAVRGIDTSAAVPALTEALQDGDAETRVKVLRALLCAGANAHPAMPAVLRALKDEAAVRKEAAEVLGRTGLRTDPAIVAGLLAALQDDDAEVRQEAAEALGRLGTPSKDVIPALRRALDDPDERVRKEAKESLDRLTGAAGGGPGSKRR
jgi:HEAT repeat protein